MGSIRESSLVDSRPTDGPNDRDRRVTRHHDAAFGVRRLVRPALGRDDDDDDDDLDDDDDDRARFRRGPVDVIVGRSRGRSKGARG